MTDVRFPRPLRNRVLVKELPPEQTSASGLIHLPDQAKGVHEQNWRALVLAVGPGKAQPRFLKDLAAELEQLAEFAQAGAPDDPDGGRINGRALGPIIRDIREAQERGFGADVAPGDLVICSKYIHTDVRVGEETCRIVAATDILAVLEEASDPRVAEQCREVVRRVLGAAPPG